MLGFTAWEWLKALAGAVAVVIVGWFLLVLFIVAFSA